MTVGPRQAPTGSIRVPPSRWISSAASATPPSTTSTAAVGRRRSSGRSSPGVTQMRVDPLADQLADPVDRVVGQPVLLALDDEHEVGRVDARRHQRRDVVGIEQGRHRASALRLVHGGRAVDSGLGRPGRRAPPLGGRGRLVEGVAVAGEVGEGRGVVGVDLAPSVAEDDPGPGRR